MQKGEFIIITGLSGAGKSLALKCFEDMNYFCVDNLLPALIPVFAQLCDSSEISNVAVVVDIRGGEFFESLMKSLKDLPDIGYRYHILYLDAPDEVLVRRYSETKRRHPLSKSGRILRGIHQERKLLAEIKGMANKVLDTSEFSPHRLKRELTSLYGGGTDSSISISILSFGFKYGIPLDVDMVFDVRFLPNPYYIEEFKRQDGEAEPVRNYILKFPEAQEFLEKLFDMMEFLVPRFIEEGKSYLTIAIGCTGGRHRSITIANELMNFLQSKGYEVNVEHRDRMK